MCADTDVFLLLMYAYEKHKLSCTIIMEDPVAGRTVCDIKASAVKNLGRTKQYVQAHVLSGYDSLSQLYEIGKGGIVKAIQNDVYLNKLGDIHESIDNVYNECAQLMLACYGAQKSASMSAARYDLWLSKLSKKLLLLHPH